MLIKYIKSVHWRVAKRLSYIEEVRCLKVNDKFAVAYLLDGSLFVSFRVVESTGYYTHFECGLTFPLVTHIALNCTKGISAGVGVQWGAALGRRVSQF